MGVLLDVDVELGRDWIIGVEIEIRPGQKSRTQAKIISSEAPAFLKLSPSATLATILCIEVWALAKFG